MMYIFSKHRIIHSIDDIARVPDITSLLSVVVVEVTAYCSVRVMESEYCIHKMYIHARIETQFTRRRRPRGWRTLRDTITMTTRMTTINKNHLHRDDDDTWSNKNQNNNRKQEQDREPQQ